MTSSNKNLSVVLYGKNDLRLEHRDIPKPKSNEALLQVEYVGICGSDLHFWVHGSIGTYVVEKPVVIGHEASGTVVEVGVDVKNLKPGDRVAIEPGVACNSCDFCKAGSYHLCDEMVFCACPPHDGDLAQYYCQSANFLHKLPDNVSLEEGCLLEPFAVSVHACKRGQVSADSIVLILGAGPIGLCTILAALAYGATKIIVTDLVDFRLEEAKKLGANYTLKIDPNASERDIVKIICETLGEEPTVSFDCTGTENCVRIGMLATKKNGVMVVVGMGKSEMNLPLFEAQCKEVDIRGCFRYCNDYPTALKIVAAGKTNLKELVTHRYKLEDSLEAFDTALNNKENAIKVMICANWAFAIRAIRGFKTDSAISTLALAGFIPMELSQRKCKDRGDGEYLGNRILKCSSTFDDPSVLPTLRDVASLRNASENPAELTQITDTAVTYVLVALQFYATWSAEEGN